MEMSRRQASYVDLEIFRKTATWAEQIVNKDSDFQDYAGASFDGAKKMAALDVFLRYLAPNPKICILLKLYRLYLIQMKKAYFSSVIANQWTMLAFLRGKTKHGISATKRAT